MKNRDRDDKHRRRRDAGDTDSPDGRALAAALYGGPDNSDEDEQTDEQ